MRIEKHKPLRLKGKKKLDLYRAVAERDGNRCVSCNQYIEPGTIPHHRIRKSQGGEDTMENLEMLCAENCHHITDGKLGG